MESKKHLRKLLQLHQARGGDRGLITTVHNATSSSPSSSTSSSSPSSSLDSSMALTLFVLLIALFFMAFFSVFIRHFAADDDDSTADISSSIPRRRRSSSSTMSPRGRFSSRRKGLDSQAVRSLPVYRYTKAAKQRIEDCVICLSDFEEGETVKMIPHCGHVFHVDCVDTWLSSHVSCPFCRSSQVLPDQGLAGSSCRSTVEEHDTVGPCMRRCSSCSSLGQRTGLERSLSL